MTFTDRPVLSPVVGAENLPITDQPNGAASGPAGTGFRTFAAGSGACAGWLSSQIVVAQHPGGE